MLICVFLEAISKFLAKLINSGEKLVLLINTFFAFIKVAIFPLLSFKIRVVLNYNGLVYFNISQHLFLSSKTSFISFFYKNFCCETLLAFLITQ